MFGGDRLAFPMGGEDGVFDGEIGTRQVGRITVIAGQQNEIRFRRGMARSSRSRVATHSHLLP